MKKKVLFISSTGGHLNEMLQLAPMFEKYDYHIITEKDEAKINTKKKYHFYHMEREVSYYNIYLNTQNYVLKQYIITLN